MLLTTIDPKSFGNNKAAKPKIKAWKDLFANLFIRKVIMAMAKDPNKNPKIVRI